MKLIKRLSSHATRNVRHKRRKRIEGLTPPEVLDEMKKIAEKGGYFSTVRFQEQKRNNFITRKRGQS